MNHIQRLFAGFERIRWPQAFLLAVFCASVVCTLVFTPPEIVDRLAALNWRAIASGTVAVLTALAGIWGGSLVKPKAPTPERFSELPPPISEPPPSGPPSLLALGLACIVAASSSGCGASAVQQHTTAIQVTATALDGATELAEVAVTSELAACRDVPCTHDVEARWAPVETASAAVILAMQGWVVALDVVRATGADDAPGAIWRATLRAVESLGIAWGRLVDAARAVGVTLPELPPIVTQAASLLGRS